MATEMFTITDNPNITHWDQEAGYTNDRIGNEYPLRNFNSKTFGGLIIYIRLLKCDMAYECRGPFHGFSLTLSSPEDMNGLSRRVIHVSPNEQTSVSIRPKLIFSSKKVGGYKPVERQCYKNDERHLRFFKFYCKHNCEMECLANFTEKLCGCVKFSMPRDKDTKICGSQNVGCYVNAENKLFGEDIIDALTDEEAKSFHQNCDCLPACNKTVYGMEIDRAHLDLTKWVRSYDVQLDRTDEYV